MTTVTLCSASGAPGVTTTTLALAWVWPHVHPGRRVLVVDADPAGSGLLPGVLQARVGTGGGALALAARRVTASVFDVLDQAVPLDGDGSRLVLTGVSEPVQARPLAPVWSGLCELTPDLDATGLDVLVDAGRIGHRFEPTRLLDDADVLAVVLRPTLPAAVAATAALRALAGTRSPRPAPRAVQVGEHRPYSAGEVARAISHPVTVVAHDPRAADALNSGETPGTRLDRSALLRSARALAAELTADIATAVAR